MIMKKIESFAIEQAVQLAVTEGNAILEISEGWTQVRQVVHMRSAMSASVRNVLMADGQLRYWRASPTPHNASDEGFSDDAEKVAVSFPCC
jgi:2-methylcitrate dehydratase PrpD